MIFLPCSSVRITSANRSLNHSSDNPSLVNHYSITTQTIVDLQTQRSVHWKHVRVFVQMLSNVCVPPRRKLRVSRLVDPLVKQPRPGRCWPSESRMSGKSGRRDDGKSERSFEGGKVMTQEYLSTPNKEIIEVGREESVQWFSGFVIVEAIVYRCRCYWFWRKVSTLRSNARMNQAWNPTLDTSHLKPS